MHSAYLGDFMCFPLNVLDLHCFLSNENQILYQYYMKMNRIQWKEKTSEIQHDLENDQMYCTLMAEASAAAAVARLADSCMAASVSSHD